MHNHTLTDLAPLNNLLLCIVYTVPAVVLSSALLTFFAYWLLIGRHASKTPDTTQEND